MPETRKKIVCAMSGGVDSSVAAAILKNQGHNVIGVFMLLWAESKGSEDARKVAKKLGIPFYVLNFEKEFKKQVVRYFLEGYASGLTPNPCVECNRKIKFDLLIEKALGVGGEYVATGHYIRKLKVKSLKLKVVYKLFRAKDKDKDQSYFLYTLTQKQLEYALFPLGDYTKSEARLLADKWRLPYQKKESQEICFISEKKHNEFLKRHLKLRPGKIICQERVIGEHQGLPLYTIGQRREIGLSGGPYWVIGFDFKKNLLKVTDVPNDPLLYRASLEAQKVNWISGGKPSLPLNVQAKIRYGHKAVPAVVTQMGTNKNTYKHKLLYRVNFKEPQRAVTPGQSVVFYKGERLLGGGLIAFSRG